ncbi:TetR family transcriptional regulator C-terminal domain-containing protein [Lichenicoccus sp.]|uniref:TetR/AcrR family transcriptional regulator n=1 Tax=Lichenicoccus sp. TaxID=2781899 RepID=UPI003D0C82E1
MGRPSHRDRILIEGLRVVHERGFGGASVRDIVQAAGVPQGSFSNHFRSKEAFGLEILDLYMAQGREAMERTLGNVELAPLQRLRAYLDASQSRLDDMRHGCVFGNFAAEAGDCGDLIRQRIARAFKEVTQSVAACLRAAVAVGELPQGFACDDVAGFTVASLQGAILLAKVQRTPAPMERLRKILFEIVLR